MRVSDCLGFLKPGVTVFTSFKSRRPLYDHYCLYFYPKVMVKLTRRAEGHFRKSTCTYRSLCAISLATKCHIPQSYSILTSDFFMLTCLISVRITQIFLLIFPSQISFKFNAENYTFSCLREPHVFSWLHSRAFLSISIFLFST